MTNTTEALPERLRKACDDVRRKAIPLSDMIPLMQQAADALAAMASKPAPQHPGDALRWAVRHCGANQSDSGYWFDESAAGKLAALLAARPAEPAEAPPLHLSRAVVRDIFIRHGFTVKEGQTDLKDYVYAAASELASVAAKIGAAAAQPKGAMQAAPALEDLRDRLVAISEAVADQDDRAAQAMLGEALRALAASPLPDAQAPQPVREPLTDAELTEGWDACARVENPFSTAGLMFADAVMRACAEAWGVKLAGSGKAAGQDFKN